MLRWRAASFLKGWLRQTAHCPAQMAPKTAKASEIAWASPVFLRSGAAGLPLACLQEICPNQKCSPRLHHPADLDFLAIPCSLTVAADFAPSSHSLLSVMLLAGSLRARLMLRHLAFQYFAVLTQRACSTLRRRAVSKSRHVGLGNQSLTETFGS